MIPLAALILLLASPSVAAESQCYGKVGDGRIERSVALPPRGPNFSAYSSIAVAAGRTHVHSKVAEIVAAAYAALHAADPATVYVYGETGWPSGGAFPPHRTHQNGLSVDFFVPVRDASGASVPIPTSPLTRFGYDLEFDGSGRHEGLTIDFAALAQHLYELHRAARSRGVGIALVIFDPQYLPQLFATSRGEYLKQNLPFMKGKPWVRHDEHYHVDFAVPCKRDAGMSGPGATSLYAVPLALGSVLAISARGNWRSALLGLLAGPLVGLYGLILSGGLGPLREARDLIFLPFGLLYYPVAVAFVGPWAFAMGAVAGLVAPRVAALRAPFSHAVMAAGGAIAGVIVIRLLFPHFIVAGLFTGVVLGASWDAASRSAGDPQSATTPWRLAPLLGVGVCLADGLLALATEAYTIGLQGERIYAYGVPFPVSELAHNAPPVLDRATAAVANLAVWTAASAAGIAITRSLARRLLVFRA